MNKQINIRLPPKVLTAAKHYADSKGYGNVQEFIKEAVREKLFDKKELERYSSALLSEKSLAKAWLNKGEDEAWKHLHKEM